MADKNQGEVKGINKKGEIVQLPDLIVKSIIEDCTIDGEIISDKLFVFDILSLSDRNVKMLECIDRWAILKGMEFGDNVEVVRTAFSKAEKQKLYNDLRARNAEGIVFKLKDSKYTAGRPNSGGTQLKNKFQKEASFIVRDWTKGKRSVGLELIDRDNNDERVHMGKCTIPPNKEVPAIGAVVEVRYLYAYRGGKIFQPCYKEERNDVYPKECLMTQIIYKAGEQEEED